MAINEAIETFEKFKRCNDTDPIDCRVSRCSVCENRYSEDELYVAIDIAIEALKYCKRMNIGFE